MKAEVVVVPKDVNIYEGDLATADQQPTLDDKESSALREQAKKWSKSKDMASVTLSGVLFQVRKHNAFRQWGFHTFRDYIEQELGICIRSAEYMVKLWDHYVVKEGNNTKEFLDRVQVLGWVKMKESMDFLRKDNADKVLPKIEPMSVRQLMSYKKDLVVEELKKEDEAREMRETLKRKEAREQGKTTDELEVDATPSKMIQFSVKLYAEQYSDVDKALKLASTMGAGNSKKATCKAEAEHNTVSCTEHSTLSS